jgi:hypothetical protein
MVQDQKVVGRTSISLNRVDLSLEARFYVKREDLRVEAHPSQVALKVEHLLRYRIPVSGAGMELVDGRKSDHFVATMM